MALSGKAAVTFGPMLSGKTPYTVFAPSNEAFAALPASTLSNLLKPENAAQLVDLLEYHVTKGAVRSTDLKDMERIKTLEGKDVMARVHGSDVLINSAKVTTANLGASNGVVHIIDEVLLPGHAPAPAPAPAQKNIVQLVSSNADLSTLVTALSGKAAVTFGPMLSGKTPYTVFAPSNEAFAALPASTLSNLLKPENAAQLVDLLEYHVTKGSVRSTD